MSNVAKWLGCFVLFCGSYLFALEPTDRVAIEQVIQDYTDAWNFRGGKGYANKYAENADFINIFGMKFSGRAEIEKRHMHILQTFLKDSRFEVLQTELREVQPGLVLATVYWRTHGYRNPGTDLSKSGTVREGIFSHVFVHNEGQWLIAMTQNTLKPEL